MVIYFGFLVYLTFILQFFMGVVLLSYPEVTGLNALDALIIDPGCLSLNRWVLLPMLKVSESIYPGDNVGVFLD